MADDTHKSWGKRNKAVEAKKVLMACTSLVNNDTEEDVCKAIGVSWNLFYQYTSFDEPGARAIEYDHPKRKDRVSKIGHIKKLSVIDFFHSDQGSTTDLSSRYIIIVDGDKHMGL